MTLVKSKQVIETRTMAVAELVSDPDNARTHPNQNLTAIRKSLERFGQVEPLVVQRGTNVVVGGNGRLETMRSMGWTKTRVVFVDVSDVERKALGIALNRTSDLAEWDEGQLGALLEDIKASEEDLDVDALLESVSFTDKQMEKLIQVSAYQRRETAQDEVPEPPKVAVTKLGDVWVLGRHRLVCGDSTEAQIYDDADCVFTDPPYGVNHKGRMHQWAGDAEPRTANIANDTASPESLLQLIRSAVPIKQFTYVCSGWESLGVFEAALGRPRSVCVWDKNSIGFGGGYRRQFELVMFWGSLARNDLSDVWRFNRVCDYQRPTQKPVELAAKALADCGAHRIYDPFLGSGTTLIAAEQLDRTCYGVEIEPCYCDVVVERWENLTGGKARRESP